MSNKIYHYPFIIRLWHAINAIGILILIFTGLSIQYSDPAYPFMRFDLAIKLHNYSGVILSISYFLFFFGNIFTGNVRHYYIKFRGWFDRLYKQGYYYSIGIFKGQNPPFPISETVKFNPLQRLSYTFIMYFFVPVLIFTGICMLYPELIPNKIFGLVGLFLVDLVHIISAFIVSIFLIIHLYFITIGNKPLKNFKSIITGWHEEHH
jgi:thiosulfate reductase cytochrome b subunit